MLEGWESLTDFLKSKRAGECHFSLTLQPGWLDTCRKLHKYFPSNWPAAWVLPTHSSRNLSHSIHLTQQELLQNTSCHICLILQEAPAGICTTPKCLLPWGGGQKQYTSVYSQFQEPICRTGSAERVLCHSVPLQPCKHVDYLPSPLTSKSLSKYKAGKTSYGAVLFPNKTRGRHLTNKTSQRTTQEKHLTFQNYHHLGKWAEGRHLVWLLILAKYQPMIDPHKPLSSKMKNLSPQQAKWAIVANLTKGKQGLATAVRCTQPT